MSDDTLIAGPQASPEGQAAQADGATQQQAPTQQPSAQAADSNTQPAPAQATDAQAQQQAEVVYDLKLPEGSSLDATYLEHAKSTAKELGLTPEAAQKLVERDSAMQSKFMEAKQAEWTQHVTQWAEQVKADKEIGGERFNAAITDARTALDRFGTPEFKQMLNQSGYGNHPELIRMMSKIGAAMREDKVVQGNQPARDNKSMAELLYPSMANNSD